MTKPKQWRTRPARAEGLLKTSRPRAGFTRTEAIVIGVIVLIGIAFFIILRVRIAVATSNRVECAKNLLQIGQALLLYANENKGQYPRVRFSGLGGQDPDPKPLYGTGTMAKNPFADDGPAPNDVTAALFLLARNGQLSFARFVCPSSNNVRDDITPETPHQRSNFTDYRKNLSYSYANPYPSATAIQKGYKLNSALRADFVTAADRNPGTAGGSDVLTPNKNSPPAQIRNANSKIHGGDGQNMLYGDGHVEFKPTPFCGVNRDNIYTTADGKINASPADANDSILLPPDQ